MTSEDIRGFVAYLRYCTDRQVAAVLDKERTAKRDDYAALAEHEARRRGLETE